MDDANWKQLLMEQLPPLPDGLSRAAAIFGLALASAFIATTRTAPRFLSPPPSPPHSPVEPVADADDGEDPILELNDEPLIETGRRYIECILCPSPPPSPPDIEPPVATRS
eukprot:6886399-Prymnesium_polylepis.2